MAIDTKPFPETILTKSRYWSPWLVGYNIRQFNLNTLLPRQNVRLFADDTFKRIFLNGHVKIWIKIPLKFVPKGPINKVSALVQIMDWRRPGDKPLSEPMMVRLPTDIRVTRPQLVNVWQHWSKPQMTWWRQILTACVTSLQRINAKP